MTTVFYEARHDYEATRDGRLLGPWRTGQPVSPQRGDLPWLVRDAPGLFDLSRPLTGAQVMEAVQRLERDRDEAALRERNQAAALKDHARRYGRWCLGAVAREPHEVLTRPLSAVESGGGWRVGCLPCLDRPTRPGES